MIALSADDVTKLARALEASPGRYAHGMLYPTAAAQAILADPDWRNRPAPATVPDVTPYQIVSELEARGLFDAFYAQLSAVPANLLKFLGAREIYRADPRTQQMGAAFGLDEAGLNDLFREAAKR